MNAKMCSECKYARHSDGKCTIGRYMCPWNKRQIHKRVGKYWAMH